MRIEGASAVKTQSESVADVSIMWGWSWGAALFWSLPLLSSMIGGWLAGQLLPRHTLPVTKPHWNKILFHKLCKIKPTSNKTLNRQNLKLMAYKTAYFEEITWSHKNLISQKTVCQILTNFSIHFFKNLFPFPPGSSVSATDSLWFKESTQTVIGFH